MVQIMPASMFPAKSHTMAAGSSAIGTLGAAVGAACDGSSEAKGPRIIAALRAAIVSPGVLTPDQCAPDCDHYARHTLYADPAGRFTILSLVWGPGQFSPPHAHAVWCAYAVVDRTLTETLYRFDAARQKAVALGATARDPGYACFAQAGLDQIHRLGNAGSEPAISLHVYGVESERVCTHVNRLVDVAGQEG
jgi:predicted metal-dependent enzyme (double-stranded beta helix superfamily)